ARVPSGASMFAAPMIGLEKDASPSLSPGSANGVFAMFDWFKKTSSWNALAAEAFARCEHDLKGATYREFVQALPVLQRQAVLLTHLDPQVRNGGSKENASGSRSP